MEIIELSIFSSRINAICEEMGAVLQRAAFSPNIKDRLDFSCAIFDAAGDLCAQAAHIPVHLGSMAYAMRDIVSAVEWHPGDMLIVNDPYLGGTHLPDITLIAPLFINHELISFVANRAHHSDIGADTPGSMPISRSLEEEGIVIAPTLLVREGELDAEVMTSITAATSNRHIGEGDFAAQISANRCGVNRLQTLVEALGVNHYGEALHLLNDYAQRLAYSALKDIPDGEYSFEDVMDDDGLGNEDISVCVKLTVDDGNIKVDFDGTAAQVDGNINCPLSVAAAGVYYVFRCLMPSHTPACAGSFRHITICAAEGSLVNAQRPAAVAAGNVETSTRIVDVVMGALAQAIPERIPAASHGSMNNVAMGSRDNTQPWDYYETIGGGMGAGCDADGTSAVQTHMTNTLNTPIESFEMHYPARITRYGLRDDSGGRGLHRGGDGLVREFEFLVATTVTLLTERRRHAPWGLGGGNNAICGENLRNGQTVPGKICYEASPGERLTIKTAGGGGWGAE